MKLKSPIIERVGTRAEIVASSLRDSAMGLKATYVTWLCCHVRQPDKRTVGQTIISSHQDILELRTIKTSFSDKLRTRNFNFNT